MVSAMAVAVDRFFATRLARQGRCRSFTIEKGVDTRGGGAIPRLTGQGLDQALFRRESAFADSITGA